jgi:hypothetical protein
MELIVGDYYCDSAAGMGKLEFTLRGRGPEAGTSWCILSTETLWVGATLYSASMHNLLVKYYDDAPERMISMKYFLMEDTKRISEPTMESMVRMVLSPSYKSDEAVERFLVSSAARMPAAGRFSSKTP